MLSLYVWLYVCGLHVCAIVLLCCYLAITFCLSHHLYLVLVFLHICVHVWIDGSVVYNWLTLKLNTFSVLPQTQL